MTNMSAFFGLCCLLAPASAAWGKKSGDSDATGSSQADLAAQVQELSKAVQAQTSRIAKLESQLAAQKKAAQVKQQCASSSAPSTGFDLQPELQPFRLAEAQRALQRQREQITSLYSAAVGTPLTAVALSSHLLEKNVPRLAAAADTSGVLRLFDRSGDEVTRVQTDHAAGSRVTAVVFGSKEEPFVATAGTDGQVLVYDLSLPRPQRAKKKKPVNNSMTAEEQAAAAEAEAAAAVAASWQEHAKGLERHWARGARASARIRGCPSSRRARRPARAFGREGRPVA
jgi:WD40 repeat protein